MGERSFHIRLQEDVLIGAPAVEYPDDHDLAPFFVDLECYRHAPFKAKDAQASMNIIATHSALRKGSESDTGVFNSVDVGARYFDA